MTYSLVDVCFTDGGACRGKGLEVCSQTKDFVDAIAVNEDNCEGFQPDPGIFASLDVKRELTVISNGKC